MNFNNTKITKDIRSLTFGRQTGMITQLDKVYVGRTPFCPKLSRELSKAVYNVYVVVNRTRESLCSEVYALLPKELTSVLRFGD